MESFREHDILLARATPPGEKLRQALELMDQGFELKRANLRLRFPDESDEQIEVRMREWMLKDPDDDR